MKILFLALGLIASTQAFGQTQYYYDGSGNMQGRSNRAGGSTNYYNGNGNSQGWSNNVGGSTNYYDGNGNMQGSSTSDYGNFR